MIAPTMAGVDSKKRKSKQQFHGLIFLHNAATIVIPEREMAGKIAAA